MEREDFFDSKKCEFCGDRASLYRNTERNTKKGFVYMCKSRWCDFLFLVTHGFIKDLTPDKEVDPIIKDLLTRV